MKRSPIILTFLIGFSAIVPALAQQTSAIHQVGLNQSLRFEENKGQVANIFKEFNI